MTVQALLITAQAIHFHLAQAVIEVVSVLALHPRPLLQPQLSLLIVSAFLHLQQGGYLDLGILIELEFQVVSLVPKRKRQVCALKDYHL